MSQSRTSRSARAHSVWPLVLLALGIAVVIYTLEQDRSERLVDESMRPHESLDGTLLGVEFQSPVLSPAHWRRIQGSEFVSRVMIRGTERIDGSLEPLGSLPRLQLLTWNACQGLNDHHVETMSTFPALRHLDLRGCSSISDRSVPSLVAMETLETVDLQGTSLSMDGLWQLRHARPDLKIGVSWHDFAPGIESRTPFNASHLWLESSDDLDAQRRLLTLPHDWVTGTWLSDPLEKWTYLRLSGSAALDALPRLSSMLPALDRLVVTDTNGQPGESGWEDDSPTIEPFENVTDLSLSGPPREERRWRDSPR